MVGQHQCMLRRAWVIVSMYMAAIGRSRPLSQCMCVCCISISVPAAANACLQAFCCLCSSLSRARRACKHMVVTFWVLAADCCSRCSSLRSAASFVAGDEVSRAYTVSGFEHAAVVAAVCSRTRCWCCCVQPHTHATRSAMSVLLERQWLLHWHAMIVPSALV